MRILIEEQLYNANSLKGLELSPYLLRSKNNDVQIPYVGYFYSQAIQDTVFILPKVFMWEGYSADDSNNPGKRLKYLAFGKLDPLTLINFNSESILREQGYDRVLFELSTWIYRAIKRYSERNEDSRIIENAKVQNVISNRGDFSETFLDIILSLISFHKTHQHLFTFIARINSCGNNKIHWSKTLSKVQPFINNEEAFYAEFRNKQRVVNYDEEIIVLFYSVLNWLKEKYSFPVRTNLNYPVLKSRQVESMIDSGRGTRLLRSIRKKYFKDELVSLWKLLYAFFEKAESIANHNYHDESLLVHSFNLVFEDMIDSLISDNDDVSRALKTNKDDKRIDHLYKERSLIDEDLIYYIADSKYYKESTDIQGTALYKQYTYARNIIQYNIELFNRDANSTRLSNKNKKTINGVRYRDDITEGYNVTPNFFIRGSIAPEDIYNGKANYDYPRLTPELDPDDRSKEFFRVSSHFDNRLFDRDTLILKSYNINFLFVLGAYVQNKDNCEFRKKVKDTFRQHLILTFNKLYNFYVVTPTNMSVPSFVQKYFKHLIGKIYRSSISDETLWLALAKNDRKTERVIKQLISTDSIISKTELQ